MCHNGIILLLGRKGKRVELVEIGKAVENKPQLDGWFRGGVPLTF